MEHKGTLKRAIAILLVIATVCWLFPKVPVVKAAEVESLTATGTDATEDLIVEEQYVGDAQEAEEGTLEDQSEELATGGTADWWVTKEEEIDYVVPADHFLRIENVGVEWYEFNTTGKIKLEGSVGEWDQEGFMPGGTLSISGGATFTGTLEAEDGAVFLAERLRSIPVGFGAAVPFEGDQFGWLTSEEDGIHIAYPDDTEEFISAESEEYWTIRNMEFCYWEGIWSLVGDDSGGDPEIIDEARKSIYAYPAENTNDNPHTFEECLARELYTKFFQVPMFGQFGLPRVDLGLEPGRTEEFDAAVKEMEERITFSREGESIIAYEAEGEEVEVPVIWYKVAWGQDHEGNLVESEIPVFVLENNRQVLVCTDYDESTGFGTEYYLRTQGEEWPATNPEKNERGENFSQFIYTDNMPNVVVGGNAVSSIVQYCGDYCFVDYGTLFQFDDFFGKGNFGCLLRIVNPSATYVWVEGVGEEKNYDNLGVNGTKIDNVWWTGKDSYAKVYIGCPEVHIRPMDADHPIETKAIKDVKLADETMKDGVSIDTSDLEDIVLNFRSNFYSEVPVLITYEDGTVQTLLIERIGLMIQYMYLVDEVDEEGNFISNVWIFGKKHQIKLDSPGQVMVWATYFYPTNDPTGSKSEDLYLSLKYDDGSFEIISNKDEAHNFYGYQPATGEQVAASSFLIGFMPENGDEGAIYEQTFVNKWGGEGGFYATVLNAGYNGDESYGGTQIGSGKGVYWDGRIAWYDMN